ncbi:hypothetical protein EJ08DRAFT_701732 [Tothia fuscella]|uniref:Chromatin assembly factor 1 subunit A n=1 Tax=Tothia fuscella TaxID=1048955 RepID=A0A9P4NHN5_9PEZI|nr:hypothetical protein EJ08DRAFT_701732 [Tothia fuscella]
MKRPRTEDEEEAGTHTTPTKQIQLHDTPNSSDLSSPMTPSAQDLAMASATSNTDTTAGAAVTSSSVITTNIVTLNTNTTSPKHSVPATGPPTKRRKTTQEERVRKAAEKEAEKARKESEKEAEKARKEAGRVAEKAKKDAEREAEKVKKDAEREAERAAKQAKKDEDERKKNAEKLEKAKLAEAKKLQREAEAQAKEEKKRKAEEEKLKREKAQPRLNFFGFKVGNSPSAELTHGKTLKASASPTDHNFMTKDEAWRRSLSVSLEPQSPLLAPVSSLQFAATNDETPQFKAYRKHFFPYVAPKHTTLARLNPFSKEELEDLEVILTDYSTLSSKPEPSWPKELEGGKTTRGYKPVPVKDILRQLQGSANNPLDLTEEGLNKHIDLSSQITMKYIEFGQDVRPPYSGTWVRPMSLSHARRVARSPFRAVLPEVLYDYDSEAEWDDGGDGEDVDSDGEEDLDDEDGEDEMDGFLDDEGASEVAKRRALVSTTDMEPICSGLHWEDEDGVLQPAEGNTQLADFHGMRMGFLLEPCPKTVDPLSTMYWDDVTTSKSANGNSTISSLMAPPRLPLQDKVGAGNIPATVTVGGVIPKALKAAPRVIAAEYLTEFKAFINGRDDTKSGLIENLKREFGDKMTKDQIKDTLPLVAEKKGRKRGDKWTLLDECAPSTATIATNAPASGA